jgi:hypothetical protein
VPVEVSQQPNENAWLLGWQRSGRSSMWDWSGREESDLHYPDMGLGDSDAGVPPRPRPRRCYTTMGTRPSRPANRAVAHLLVASRLSTVTTETCGCTGRRHGPCR